MALRNYTRWRRDQNGRLDADLLGSRLPGISVSPSLTRVDMLPGDGNTPPVSMSPDEARLIGVRLIEAAALADGDRTIRATP
jgi:hypothetical protein